MRMCMFMCVHVYVYVCICVLTIVAPVSARILVFEAEKVGQCLFLDGESGGDEA